MSEYSERSTAARLIAATLEAHGVDRIFCVAGESYLALLDALVDLPGIDVVTCRHEGAAGFMALADAKLTGRAGVCLVNRAPGATNASIALHSAAQDAEPLLLVVGHVCTDEIGRDAFQEIDYSTTFTGLAKQVWTLHDPGHAPEFVARALRVAESGTPGPTVLVVPQDVLERPSDASAPSGPWRPTPGHPDPRGVGHTARLLASARRPLLVAGGRLGSTGGRRAVREFSERHTVPVAVSNKHPDLFDNRHSHYAGHLYNGTPDRQRSALDDADLLLAVGTRLDVVTTRGHRLPGTPRPRHALVHVYPDAEQLGRVHTPTLGMSCDPTAFLTALTSRSAADAPAPDVAADRQDWAARLRAVESDRTAWRPHSAPDGVVFGAVVAALDQLTGGDVVLTVDAGSFTSWLFRYLRLTGRGRLFGVASSAMGFGVPAGVSAALRHPGRPVVTVVGDGGFLMTGSELATAVGRGLRLVIVVADNGSYGTIRLHQERAYPQRVMATDLVNPDFARLAEAYGARGLSVRSQDDIVPALRAALDHDGPAVVHVRSSLTWTAASGPLDLPENAR
jgi:acetolactate synthase-1/2/3 large subunit